jgi:hypothetical protein
MGFDVFEKTHHAPRGFHCKPSDIHQSNELRILKPDLKEPRHTNF